ncbi:MAG: Trm112 family protein [Desulfovibrionaceae bacterium]|nr:Trm112 family protein [Desulfovibrionaceae bacterium]
MNPKLLELLACPVCRTAVEAVDNGEGLLCRKCGLIYPVQDEIPIMLQEEAIPQQEWKNKKKNR